MLDITGVRKPVGGFDLGPVDLSVGAEVLAVLGPSGSGKTTLLSVIAGHAAAEAGSITLEGRSLRGREPEDRRIGLVPQDGALFPHMTVRENVAYATDDPDRVRDLLAAFEIDDLPDRRPATLSGGERQRVALARSLAADPDALLLDEPLASLDVRIRRRLREELQDLFESLGVPIVYVTHDQRTATALGDRIAVLREGRIEQVGASEEILERPASRFVARFTGSENALDASVTGRDGGAVDLRVGGTRLKAHVGRALEPGSAVAACVRPSRVDLAEIECASHEPDVSGVDSVEVATEPDEGSASSARLPEGTGRTTVTDDDNALSGTVRQWMNEGDAYRVTVRLDDGDVDLTASVSPQTFDRVVEGSECDVEVTIPPDAIHVIDGSP